MKYTLTKSDIKYISNKYEITPEIAIEVIETINDLENRNRFPSLFSEIEKILYERP